MKYDLHKLNKQLFYGVYENSTVLRSKSEKGLSIFPYQLSRQDFLLVPLGIGMTALEYVLRDKIDRITYNQISRLRPEQVNSFDRSAVNNLSDRWRDRGEKYSGILRYGTFIFIGAESAVLLLGKKFSEAAALGTMFAECWLFTLGAVNMTKAAAGRKRPYVYNTDLSVDQRYGMTSSDDNADVYFLFISGHAASAFCMAAFTSKVFTDIYGKSIWSHLVWGTCLSLASIAAYSRVKAGAHFPTDVIAGAFVGGSIGYFVPVLHQSTNRNVRLSLAANRISLNLVF